MSMVMNPVESPRLRFEILSPDKAPEVLAFYQENRAHLEPWEPRREFGFYTVDYHRLLLEAYQKELLKGSGLRFWLRLKADGRLAGALNLTQIVRGPFLSGVIGYKTHAAYTGQGLMTEAVGRLIPLAFRELGLHRLEAGLMPVNEASRRVLVRNGFRQEGYSPGYLKINGRWEDHERYALLREWVFGEDD